jgi:hypothetical protein
MVRSAIAQTGPRVWASVGYCWSDPSNSPAHSSADPTPRPAQHSDAGLARLACETFRIRGGDRQQFAKLACSRYRDPLAAIQTTPAPLVPPTPQPVRPQPFRTMATDSPRLIPDRLPSPSHSSPPTRPCHARRDAGLRLLFLYPQGDYSCHTPAPAVRSRRRAQLLTGSCDSPGSHPVPVSIRPSDLLFRSHLKRT